MKIENLDYFYNKDIGKKCLILGGAPSISNIDYKNFDGIIISMGDVPIRLRDECNVDYWVNANDNFPLPDIHYKTINKAKNTTFLFAHSVLKKPDYSVIRDRLKIKWFDYDQRHFGGQPCNDQIDSRFHVNERQDCCEHIGQTTIQEFLQEKYNTVDHYSSASTVAIHALSLAIILGCKTIYIGGVEIPIYGKDYTYYGVKSILEILKDEKGGWSPRKLTIKTFFAVVFNFKIKSVFYPNIIDILNDFEHLNNLCRHNDIKLFNLSEASNLRKIPNFKYLNPKEINAR
jgi:hypothetical protein